jgi:FeS assembly SUF system regulator
LILLSKLADYGVVLTVRLARHGEGQMNAVALAEDTHLSEATVAKVLKSLVHAGVVASLRGPSGGYRLARQPTDISVAEIVTAIDGPFGVTECASVEDSCDRAHFCSTKPHWSRINTAIQAALESVTLADMAGPLGAPDFGIVYPKTESLSA